MTLGTFGTLFPIKHLTHMQTRKTGFLTRRVLIAKSVPSVTTGLELEPRLCKTRK